MTTIFISALGMLILVSIRIIKLNKFDFDNFTIGFLSVALIIKVLLLYIRNHS